MYVNRIFQELYINFYGAYLLEIYLERIENLRTFDFFFENTMLLKINRFLYRFLLDEWLQIYLLDSAIPLITQREWRGRL